jgi:hypothetical protein
MSSPSSPSSQTLYAGFDTWSLNRTDFDDIFPSLKGYFPSLKWCGFYLGRTEKKYSFTREAHDKLVGWGYNIAPIFFGKQLWEVSDKTPDPVTLGQTDGTTAVHQALGVNIPTGSYIYFDVEPSMKQSEGWLQHYAAWAQAVVAGQYRPGAYIRWEIVDWLYDAMARIQKSRSYSVYVAAPRIWVVNYTMKDPKRPPNASQPPVRPQRVTDNLDWIGPAPDEAHTAADMYQWNPGQAYRWTDYTGDKERTFDLFPVDLNTSTDADPGLAPS